MRTLRYIASTGRRTSASRLNPKLRFWRIRDDPGSDANQSTQIGRIVALVVTAGGPLAEAENRRIQFPPLGAIERPGLAIGLHIDAGRT